MWIKIRDNRPNGHAFFHDAGNRLAIADCSGSTPDRTDDGVLYVDKTRPIFTYKDAGRVYGVPLTDGRSAPMCAADVVWLCEAHNMEIKIGDRTFRPVLTDPIR